MMRVLIWVQHLWGVGHLKRISLIADALGRRGARVTLVSGGLPVLEFERGAFTLTRLTPVRAQDASCSVLTDAEGRIVGKTIMADRAWKLKMMLEDVAPHIIITEHFPFGRRKFRHELLPFLEAARRRNPRPLILGSLRDVLEPPSDPARIADHKHWARDHYDALLVHGDPAFLKLDASAPYIAQLHLPVHYTGYVTAAAPQDATKEGSRGADRVEIVVSAGGGRSGATLLQLAADAARLMSTRVPMRWRLIGGPHGKMPASEQRVGHHSGCEIIGEGTRTDMPALMAKAALSVSRAGYNTVSEALAARIHMILVPDRAGGQVEQSLRASRLAAHGLALHLPERGLTPEALAQAVAGRMSVPRPDHEMRLDGAAQSARMIELLWQRHRNTLGMVPRKDPR